MTPEITRPEAGVETRTDVWRRWGVAVSPPMWAVVLALLHLAWVLAHLAPATMSPDANGYVVQARLLAEQRATSFTTVSPAQFVGMHWLETERGVFHSRYPAGLPLIYAAAWKVGGLKAALWVNPLLASATVLLTFLLARRLAGGGFALLAELVVAGVPVTNQHALDADAHVAAAFFLVGGVVALLRFGETRGAWWGLLAGLMLGIVPAIRYPEALVGVAVAGWLVWQVRPLWRIWPAVVGAAVPLVALMAHNAAAYGAFWKTGYALTNEQTGFGWSYFMAHALAYLTALGGQGLALMFAFGAAGIAALAAHAPTRREGVLFAGVAVPLVLLYMAYYFGGGGAMGAAGNLRFLIPTFPFFAVGGVWLLQRMAEALGGAGKVAVAAVAGLQLVMGLGGSTQMLTQGDRTLTAAAKVHAVAEREVPAGSVLIVERGLAESLDARGTWKLVEESLVASGGMGLGGMGGPGMGPGARGRGPGGGMGPGMAGGRGRVLEEGQPSPQQVGKNRGQQERYAGLSPAERSERVWADVAAWAGDKPIYWLARSEDAIDAALPESANYKRITEVDAPSMMGPGMMGGGQGGAGGPGGPMAGPGGRGAGMGPGGGGMGGLGPGGGRPGAMKGGPGMAGRRGMAGPGAGGAAATLTLVRLDLGKAK
ncbi:MAG: glycosyltransferase family 39 protein [Verrucomicrobiota bacterium]